MYFCKCGGVLLVKEVEKYPANLNGEEKINNERKCDAVCPDCGEETKGLKFD
ncbi:hypothetical protein D3C85_1627360 [compost metagenome]